MLDHLIIFVSASIYTEHLSFIQVFPFVRGYAPSKADRAYRPQNLLVGIHHHGELAGVQCSNAAPALCHFVLIETFLFFY